MENKINVLLVDDHEMVRMGLRAYLSTDEQILIVGEASNGEQAIEMAARLDLDIIVMDLIMDGINGIEATQTILRLSEKEEKSVKIIILTSFLEDDLVIPALEAGAFSYMLKTSSAEDILRAIKKAANGESTLEGKVSQMLIKNNQKSKFKHDLLTQRELEVLKELALGKSNKEISESLFIGIKTVKTHISNILAKLELDDRTKAAVYANKNNII